MNNIILKNVKHFSASSFELFNNCKYKWYQRYIKGVIQPTSDVMLIGSAIHKALEIIIKKKMKGEEIILEEIISYVIIEYNLNVNECYNTIKRAVINGLNIDIQNVVGIEEKIEFRITGIPIGFLGFIDLLAIKGEKGTIIDYKTGGYIPKQDEIKDKWQSIFYAYYILKFYILNEVKIKYFFTKYNTSREVIFTKEDVPELEEKIKLQALAILNCEEFEPSINSFCSFCIFKNECKTDVQSIDDKLEKYYLITQERDRLKKELQEEYKEREHYNNDKLVGGWIIKYKDKIENEEELLNFLDREGLLKSLFTFTSDVIKKIKNIPGIPIKIKKEAITEFVIKQATKENIAYFKNYLEEKEKEKNFKPIDLDYYNKKKGVRVVIGYKNGSYIIGTEEDKGIVKIRGTETFENIDKAKEYAEVFLSTNKNYEKGEKNNEETI